MGGGEGLSNPMLCLNIMFQIAPIHFCWLCKARWAHTCRCDTAL